MQAGEGISPERVATVNALMAAMDDLLAQLRAAQVSLDRHGGALQAGDDEWVYRQGVAVTRYKKASGAAMIVVANRLEALLQLNEKEGVKDLTVTAEDVRRHRDALLATGATSEEVEAARMIGVSAADVAEFRKERLERLQANPDELVGQTVASALSRTANEMRSFGLYLNSLPAVPLPPGEAAAARLALARRPRPTLAQRRSPAR